MSGRSSLLLLLLVACGTLHAQMLPDIEQFEVENVRLILLNGKGERQGVLSGALARKGRDGRVTVSKAALKIERGGESIILDSEEFIYEPDTSKFESPQGLTVALPNDGRLVIPKGNGRIKFTEGMQLTMNVDGEATLRDGPEDASLVTALVVNPEIQVKAHIETVVINGKSSDQLRLDSFKVTGTRGGNMKLRLAHLPSLADEQDPAQAVVDVSCFGNLVLFINEREHIANLSMLRRARMAMDDEERQFEVTSNQLDVAGNYTREIKDGKEGPARLNGLAVDASQNVSIKGNEFTGTGGILRYREFAAHREARLENDPSLQLTQGVSEDGRVELIDMRARQYIDALIPTAVEYDESINPRDQRPASIATELSGGARVKRFLDRDLEWQITGRLVRLFSFRDTTTDDRYNHTFDGYAEGFSPLLRLYGPMALPMPTDTPDSDEDTPKLQRASVFGARAEGSFISGMAHVDVYGPDVLGVLYSNAPLSDLLKVAIGLKDPERDEKGDNIPLPPRDGRLVVRADELLSLDLSTTYTSNAALSAVGSVTLDHEPLPRDDANLVTLTGDEVALSLQGGEIRYARVSGEESLATIGYDLLMCTSIEVNDQFQRLRTSLTGPGRMIMRDPESVAYFTRELDRLPKRPDAPETPRPDAAWLNFGASLVADISKNRRVIEAESPLYMLVSGEFEKPRAGRSAVNDLAELTEPEVVQLYEASGRRAYATSARASESAPGINLISLEGDAYVNSRLDGITARAAEAIELSGSERQQAEDAPFSIVLRRDADLQVDDAGIFFGEYVQSGVFAYDKTWRLQSAERLEVTLRPLETPGDAGGDVAAARNALGKALAPNAETSTRLEDVDAAIEALEPLVAARNRPADPAANRPWEAYDKLKNAREHLWFAYKLELARMVYADVERHVALRGVRRARSLLSGLIDVVGSGGISGGFRSSKSTVPPLDITMRNALFTFDGLGQIVDVNATGPIVVSRETYAIHGNSLKRAPDGTLTLDGASITLPPDTGVEISGVRSVALRQREDKVNSANEDVQRTMVTRVSGRDLKVKVTLADDQE